ncbi:PREDICTED: mucin-2-like, partial [Cercocebus atys]|uniref:mucin-2-like n=1 Tax=Cercocebus atys TaxID=9531 RepID=UPI0005F4920F
PAVNHLPSTSVTSREPPTLHLSPHLCQATLSVSTVAGGSCFPTGLSIPLPSPPQDAVGSFCRADTVLFFPGPCPFFAAVCTAVRAWHGWPTASLYTWPLEDEASATLAFLWVQEGAHPSPGAPLTWSTPPLTWSTPHRGHPSPGAPPPLTGSTPPLTWSTSSLHLQHPSPRAPLPGTCPHVKYPSLRAPFTWSTPLLAPCLEHSLATCTWVTTCLSDLG